MVNFLPKLIWTNWRTSCDGPCGYIHHFQYIAPLHCTTLNLTVTRTPHFLVMVGNGSHLQCQGIYNNIKNTQQKQTFTLPLYLLPIEGTNIVLGIARMRTLGPIHADFLTPPSLFNTMKLPSLERGILNPDPHIKSFTDYSN